MPEFRKAVTVTHCALLTAGILPLNRWQDATATKARRRCVVGLLLSLIFVALRAFADAPVNASQPLLLPTITGVKIGFDGKFKVGVWTPVWVEIENRPSDFRGSIEISTPDGDGVPVRYRSSERSDQNLCYVKFGRTSASLTVQLRDGDGSDDKNTSAPQRVIATRTFASAELPTALFSFQRLIVTIGHGIGVEEAAKLGSQNDQDAIQQVVVKDLSRLPSSVIGYEAIDTLIIPTARRELLDNISPTAASALADWVRLGGRLVVCAGQNGPTLLEGNDAASSPLFENVRQLLPPPDATSAGNAATTATETVAAVSIRRAPGLEAFVNAKQRLEIDPQQPLVATSWRPPSGVVDLYEASGARQEIPLVRRCASGLGQIHFLAFDPDQPPLSTWSERPRLIAKLLQRQTRKPTDNLALESSSQVMHLGYDDIAGQLRAGLEQFPAVTNVNFSAVAALAVVYLLLLGPVDFFLLHYLRKPEWTWYTFPLLVAAACWGTFALSQHLRGTDRQLNQATMVDLDLEQRVVRASTWSHLFTPQAARFDLQLAPIPGIEMLGLRNAQTGGTVAWQGLPGRGIGGLNGNATTSIMSESYATTHTGDVSDLPIPAAGTKSIWSQSWLRGERTDKPDDTLRSCASLSYSQNRDDGLKGRFKNPFAVELRECSLLFGTSIYAIDQTLKPGDEVDLASLASKRRDLERRLTRRRVTHETKETITPWDEASLDVPRILEIMMFHEAAGGTSYTRLAQRYQSFVDLSEHLPLGRAILVGRADVTAPQLLGPNEPVVARPAQSWTYFRAVFPVDHAAKKK